MKKRVLLIFLILSGLCNYSVSGKPGVIDGYPVANFALTVNVSENGNLYGKILQNPGQLGEWLSDRGSINICLEKNNVRHLFSDFKQKNINRSFPFVKNSYEGSPVISSKIDLQTFCPLGINDLATSSLPALLLELTCSATSDETFNLIISPDSSITKNVQTCESGKYSGIVSRYYQMTCNSKTQWKNRELIVPVSLKAGEQKTFHILAAFYDDKWISANQFVNIEELTDYVHQTWSVLKEKTALFDSAIPQTGDKLLDKYLRWYMIPGISLTKCTKDNNVLTMGYRELNQRDSYWTSWLHLVLFKDAERRMINESVEHQQASGKIPTTILPLIERNDDLDINAFFILRAARFYQYYNDRENLAEWLPALVKAMDWLISRDSSGDGLPAQVSFWGDWKDVGGVADRKYSPFSGLIYLAALKQMMFICEECGDNDNFKKYESAYQKGYTFINKSTEDGGLWNGDYYCQIWKDGQINDKLLQDQTIGILFDVVPEDRALKIINSLNAKSLTPYGIAETFPYYPAEFGYKPATYHNGAVWPWLSFMDCWARIRVGKIDEAVELVKKVANADLVESGDWSPNEHINSLTGENLGFQLQGWNAGLFGLVYFGIVHPGIIPGEMKASARIRFNQLGFYPAEAKVAVVLSDSLGGLPFAVCDVETGRAVFRGIVSAPRMSAFSGRQTSILSFDDLRKPGQYRIEIPGWGASRPFAIRERLLKDMIPAVMKAFYYQRASTPVEAEYAGKWSRPAGHPDDRVFIHPSAVSPGRPSETVISASKGWYDAGDYNKYIVNSGFTLGTLLSLYEDYPEAVRTLNINIPESGNSVPDLLDEVYWNISWMLAMQDPADGGVYHKLTEPQFEGFIAPSECRKPRYAVAKSVTATLDFAASLAQASRLYAAFEADYPGEANRMLAAATRAFDWALAHPGVFYNQRLMNESFEPDITTGEYGDRSATDEFFWAAVELYLTARDEKYLAVAREHAPERYILPVWSQVSGLGLWSLIRHADVLKGNAREMASEARAMLLRYTDSAAHGVDDAPYAAPYGRDARDFFWGCNSDAASNQGITFLYAFRQTGNRKYLTLALHNMDCLLGRNATGYCYVTGFGFHSPMHPHHRLSASDGIPEPLPGFLVGGPNPGRQDGCEYPSDIPDECYADVEPSYASNEIAINWQGLFTYFATALDASL